MKLKFWVNLIAFGMLSLIILIGCTSRPSESNYISQPNSDILDKLIQISDLNDSWNWLSNITRQNQITPTSENHELLEKASRDLSGIYLGKYYIALHHEIQKYSATSNITVINKIDASEFSTLNLELTKVVSNQISSCYIDSELQSKVCDIKSIYNSVLSKVNIIFPIEIKDALILQITNLVLEKINIRIQ